MGKADEIAARVRPHGGNAGLRIFAVQTRIPGGGAGLAEHHPSLAHHFGEDLVVAGQMREELARSLIDVAEILYRLVGRGAVGLREHYVEGDRRDLPFIKPREQIGKQGARPRPLPIGAQAVLVDIDDDHRPLAIRARTDLLIDVKAAQPQLLEPVRVPHAQQHKAEHKEEAEGAAGGERLPQLEEDVFHRELIL